MEYRENEIHAKIRQYKFWIEQNTIQMRHREKSCKPVVSNLFLATGRISPYWTCRGPQRWSAGGEGGCKSKFSAADGWPPSSITLALRTPTLVFGLTFFRRDDHVRGGGCKSISAQEHDPRTAAGAALPKFAGRIVMLIFGPFAGHIWPAGRTFDTTVLSYIDNAKNAMKNTKALHRSKLGNRSI